MHDAKQRTEWDHTGDLHAAILEPHRDEKKRPRPFSGLDFNPLRRNDRIRKWKPGRNKSAREMFAALGDAPPKG